MCLVAFKMTEHQNIFMTPIRHIRPQSQYQQHLDEIYQNGRAINFHLSLRTRQCFQIMRPTWQERVSRLQCFFEKFRIAVTNQKVEKVEINMKVIFLKKMRRYRQIRTTKSNRQNRINKLMKDHKSKAILHEWKVVVKVDQLGEILQNMRKSELVVEFIELLRQRHQSHLFRALQSENRQSSSSDLYSQNLKEKVFSCLVVNAKTARMRRFLKGKFLEEFIKRTRRMIREEIRVVQSFQRKSSIFKCFMSWKELFHLSVAQQFYKQNYLSKYFQKWKGNLSILVQERQVDQNNDCIVDIFIERSHQKLVSQIFKNWHQYSVEVQQNRLRASVLNNFADKKRKKALLSTYFEKMRIYCVNSQVKRKFYFNKLKRKAIDGFKMYFRQAVEREEKIIEFMEKREIRKYFKKIQTFNSHEHNKIKRHLQKKVFKTFTESIISTYCQKIDLADTFRTTNLLYKVLFSFKKLKLFQQQQQYLIQLVNVLKPLRRWHKGFQIRKFQRQRQLFIKRALFREWKVSVIRKDSQRKVVRQFRDVSADKKESINSQSRMEQFQFDNIMATIAKIRYNFEAEKETASPPKKRSRINANTNNQDSRRVPSESIDFEFSLENI